MRHLAFDPAATGEKVGTPDAWLPVAAQIADHARDLSRRGDIVANVGPNVGGPLGTACWNPILCDLDVNSTTCLPGYLPGAVDLSDEVFVLGALPFMGAITHEAAHARWSRWVPMTLIERQREGREDWTKAHIDVAVALEESRIEHLALRQWGARPHVKDALTQMALSIVLRDFTVRDTPYGASIGAALTLARHSAGIVSDEDAARYREAILKVLDEGTLATLHDLWVAFHRGARRTESDADFQAMWKITDDWLAAVRTFADENPDKGESGIPGEGSGAGAPAFDLDGHPGAGKSGSEDESGSEGESILGDAIREVAGEAAMEAEGEALDKRADKVAERRAEAKRADAERRASGRKMMEKRHGEGAHAYADFCGSHRKPEREPTPAERGAANRLGKMLEKITWRDRIMHKVERVIPGGRLRPRAAVQQAAEVQRGGRERLPMWLAKERVHTDETPVTVGIMTDVSGSMGSTEEMSAVLTYVMAAATGRVEGKVATATFGHGGILVHRAHEKAEKVQPWGAYDGTEAFRQAALLIDHELGLLDGTGARVLVIFTDSALVDDRDARYATTFMDLCKKKGVAVVWVNYGEYPGSNFGYGARVAIPYKASAADVAELLGKTVLDEVRKANRD